MRIDSSKNEKIQLLRSLKDAKNRRETGLFAVEGRKLVAEAFSSGMTIDFALFEEGKAQNAELEASLTNAGVRVFSASERAFVAAALTETSQGVIAAVHLPENACTDALSSPILILDGVQDPGNVGTILRTVEASCFGGVVFGEGCADPFSPKVVRATMGATFRVPIVRTDALSAAMEEMREKGWFFVGAALSGENFFERKPLRGMKAALIVGSEGRGISPEILRLCEKTYKIPMGGGAESLNAAVSAGIMAYDWYRFGDGFLEMEGGRDV